MKEWQINIYRGVLTGYNEAFIIDKNTKEQLEANDPKSADVIRPILRGRDIKRFSHEYADLYLIYIPWHFPLHEDPDITGASEAAESAFKAEFPAIYDHLCKFKKELSKRNQAETGIRYEWYAMQRWGANYSADFLKPKIIYPGIMRIAKSNTKNFPRFTLDENEKYFFGNDCYFITGENLDYLWVFLNSTLMGYIFRYYIYSFDETGYKIFTEYFQNIPIPIPNQELLEDAKTLRSEQNINQIDNWVFNLIGLNRDERDEIMNATDNLLGIL